MKSKICSLAGVIGDSRGPSIRRARDTRLGHWRADATAAEKQSSLDKKNAAEQKRVAAQDRADQLNDQNNGLAAQLAEAQAQLEAVFIPVDGTPVKLQVIRIEVETVDGIGIVWLADPIFVQFEIRSNKVPNLNRLFLINDVLLLEARSLHFIGGHNGSRLIYRCPAKSRWFVIS